MCTTVQCVEVTNGASVRCYYTSSMKKTNKHVAKELINSFVLTIDLKKELDTKHKVLRESLALSTFLVLFSWF